MRPEIRTTPIAGCFLVALREIRDHRGHFVKTFNEDWFGRLGLPTHWAEHYYSRSEPGVLRGLHLQLPPYGHTKLVHCLEGAVLDVVVDLRRGSPSEGEVFSIELDSLKRTSLYVPEGLAHGFCTADRPATVIYSATGVHVPDHETGIRWDTIDFRWPVREPVLSEKDAHLPAMEEFESPFRFGGEIPGAGPTEGGPV